MMNEKKLCICATTAVGTIGGIILAPVIGPLALGLPVLMGLFGKKMAEAEDLDDSEDTGYHTPIQHNDTFEKQMRLIKNIKPNLKEILPAPRDYTNSRGLSLPTKSISKRKNSSNLQKGLRGARGIPDNEEYLRRHERR